MKVRIAPMRSSFSGPRRKTSRVHPLPTPAWAGWDVRPSAVAAAVVAPTVGTVAVVGAGAVAAGPRAGRWRGQRARIPTSPTGGGRYAITRVFRTVGVFCVYVLFCGAPASGQEFSWVPVDASAPYGTARPDSKGQDTEIILPPGLAYIVEFELRVNGWGDAPGSGSPTLGVARAGVDATGFLGSNAVPVNPGVDLSPLNNQEWREIPGDNGLHNGAFMVIKTCHTTVGQLNTGRACVTIPSMNLPGCAESGLETCLDNPDFVFANSLDFAVVSTATPNYIWDAISVRVSGPAGCPTDEGRSYYLGTLILNVPAGAVGTYSFGFDPSGSSTFMNNCPGSQLPGLSKTPGHVTLELGACCTTQSGGGTPSCEDGVFKLDCQQDPNIFFIGQSCDDPGFVCPSCATDAHCADGVFCNGVETCDAAAGQCLPGTNPCTTSQDCDEAAGTCRDDSACCDPTAGTCTDRVRFSDCQPPLEFHEGTPFCADIPDADTDGVPDCIDQCPDIDDAVFAPGCVDAVPTTTEWGSAITALLLLIVGKVYYGRRTTKNA